MATATRQVEWIGVISPLQDDMISFRKIRGLYSDEEEVLLEAVAELVSPLIRQVGSTARSKGPNVGYAKHYVWGPRSFVVAMDDIDADRLFKSDPDEAEFRDLDNSDHDDRVPVVPWQYVNKMMWRIMEEAKNGPKLVLRGTRSAHTTQEARTMLQSFAVERREEAADRKIKLDDQLRVMKR